MTSTVPVFKGLSAERCQTILDWLRDNATLVSTPPDDESAKQERIYHVHLTLKTSDDHVNLLELSLLSSLKLMVTSKNIPKRMMSSSTSIWKLHRTPL
ncbi:hypothetical protein RB195_024276 [Necator americanus]|uniref:Uncharacterized protein n=1 Tax=Necator americanus TaxID=51031 RepID=A0ABR1EMH8_NECAM